VRIDFVIAHHSALTFVVRDHRGDGGVLVRCTSHVPQLRSCQCQCFRLRHIKEGDTVKRRSQIVGVLVSPALGNPIDGQVPSSLRNAAVPLSTPPPFSPAVPVNHPMLTGLKPIDAIVPIGRGRRELIIGDHQTGKTAVAIDTILNQRRWLERWH
jgi:F0F1-type ATP synthase alpha subunit